MIMVFFFLSFTHLTHAPCLPVQLANLLVTSLATWRPMHGIGGVVAYGGARFRVVFYRFSQRLGVSRETCRFVGAD